MLLVEADYQNVFYVGDVILVACAVFAFWKLEIHVEKGRDQSMSANMRLMLTNPVVHLFFCMIFCSGIVMGVTDSLVGVHLQQNLHAPSDMIGKQ